jgi:LmbE family N-acetylglucosaminyl deacetylase
MSNPYVLDPGDRVLVVTAHPDDVDFGSAGTIAGWTARGVEVTYCVCTSGEMGRPDDLPRERVAEIRRAEQRAAAEKVAVNNVTFLDHRDGYLTDSEQLRRDITRMIRRFRPRRVVAQSPEINWDMLVTAHPDHRASGAATLAAVYPDARNPHAHPTLLSDEKLSPWVVQDLWLADGPPERRNHAVDVTDTFTAKLAALHAHRSQTEWMTDLEYEVRRHLSRAATRHGLALGRLVEDFQVVLTG